MKPSITSLPVVLALVGAVACAPPPQVAVPASTGIADSITAAMNAYMAALRARDPARAAAFYAAEPNFRVYSGDTALTYDQVIALERHASHRQFQGEWDTVEVTVLGPDSAIANGHFWQVITDSAGTAQPFRGRARWTWVRRSPGWRVVEIRATPDP